MPQIQLGVYLMNGNEASKAVGYALEVCFAKKSSPYVITHIDGFHTCRLVTEGMSRIFMSRLVIEKLTGR